MEEKKTETTTTTDSTPEHPRAPVFIREVTAKYSGARRASFKVGKPSDASDFVLRVVKDNSREHFIALFLDGAHRVIGYSIVSTGTANSTLVHSREVFQHAILAGAVAVIVAHNHPSGQLEASQEDHKVTKMLVGAGRILGIPVLDHIVVTDAGFVSFSERGWL
jgi:DNA repair protein RadC